MNQFQIPPEHHDRGKGSPDVVPCHHILLALGTIAGLATANQILNVISSTFNAGKYMVNREILSGPTVNTSGTIVYLPTFVFEKGANLHLPGNESFV